MLADAWFRLRWSACHFSDTLIALAVVLALMNFMLSFVLTSDASVQRLLGLPVLAGHGVALHILAFVVYLLALTAFGLGAGIVALSLLLDPHTAMRMRGCREMAYCHTLDDLEFREGMSAPYGSVAQALLGYPFLWRYLYHNHGRQADEALTRLLLRTNPPPRLYRAMLATLCRRAPDAAQMVRAMRRAGAH